MSSSSPKRVLLSTDTVGGVWQYTVEIARAFSRRRVEVEIAILGPTLTATQRDTVAALSGVRVHDTGLPLDWTADAPSSLDIAAHTLAALAQRLNVDTVQLHTPALVAQALWHAPVLAVIHSCVGTWWSTVKGGVAPVDFVWRMAAVHAGLQMANCIVAPTQAFAQLVHAAYGLQRQIDVVHNGRSPSGVDIVGPVAREAVLTAGRLWDEGKGIVVLDAAAAAMGTVAVKAAGPVRGPHGAEARLERAQPLGLLDERSMAEAFAKARIFASAALYEPFGLVVLEAAQAGLPLVLSDIPTFRELWDGAAIFLPPTNVAEWAATLSALHAQPAICHRWGIKARARAAMYSIERFDGAMWDKHRRMLLPRTRTATAA